MKASLAAAVVCALVLAGCEPARTATPIDPPDTRQVFDQSTQAQGLLKGWAHTDDAKALKALVAHAAKRNASVFSDPHAWPDCGQVLSLADDMLNSDTIYGLTQAPSYHQRATMLGCAIEDLAARLRAMRAASARDAAHDASGEPASGQTAPGQSPVVHDALVDRYASALRASLVSRNIKASDARVDLAARYLAFRSRQGQTTCASQSMKVAREQGKPFTQAMAGVGKDCARPR